MGKSLISNPPYNLKWNVPPFANIQPRFFDYRVPPDSNANFAFILTALDWIEDKAVLLLPNGVLSTDNKVEQEIKKSLVMRNMIDAIILLPGGMFESTSIPACILVLNKNKKTLTVEMVDMRQEVEKEQRDQRGQFGGTSHENRVYHKTVNVITESGIKKAMEVIRGRKSIPGFCKATSFEEIKAQEYNLSPSRYIDKQEKEFQHRSFHDIAEDYNRVVREKNSLKLTVNESLAKSLGLYETFCKMKNQPDLTDSFAVVGEKAEAESYIVMSKNAAEFKIENRSKEKLPEILSLFLNMWKQHIMYLNNEENRLLAEFRDALLPDLMSGRISLGKAEQTSE